jgi:hypothetical protein
VCVALRLNGDCFGTYDDWLSMYSLQLCSFSSTMSVESEDSSS